MSCYCVYDIDYSSGNYMFVTCTPCYYEIQKEIKNIKPVCKLCNIDSLCKDCHNEILEEKLNTLKTSKFPNQFKHQISRQKKKLKMNKQETICDILDRSFEDFNKQHGSEKNIDKIQTGVPKNITILQFMQEITAASYSYGSTASSSIPMNSLSSDTSDMSFDELFL